MTVRRAAAAMLVAVSLSSAVAACRGKDEDTKAQQTAAANPQTQRDLDLALQPDTTQQPKLQDVPLSAPPQAKQAPTPQPAPQAPQPMQPAAAKEPSAFSFSTGMELPSTALAVFTDTKPPAWMMRVKVARSVTGSLIPG